MNQNNQEELDDEEYVGRLHIYQESKDNLEKIKGQPLNGREELTLRESLEDAYITAEKPLSEMDLLEKVFNTFCLKYFNLVDISEIPSLDPSEINKKPFQEILRQHWHEKLIKENRLPTGEEDDVPPYINRR